MRQLSGLWVFLHIAVVVLCPVLLLILFSDHPLVQLF